MPRAKHPKQLLPLESTPEDKRFGTSQLVAEHRAQRLKCDTIADIGCGVGFQTIAFAKTCKKVIAVEIDKDKLATAQKNALSSGLTNVTFIHGDALDEKIVKQLKCCDIIFCDTERPVGEERRTLETIKPNPKQLITVYSVITNKIAIELPPFLRDIPIEGEKEYLSVHGALSRLTLYCGSLAKAERSVVLLPEKVRVESKGKAMNPVKELKSRKYLYTINPAVVHANLLAEASTMLGGKLSLYAYDKKYYFFGDTLIRSPLLKTYKVLAMLPNDIVLIKKELLKLGVGNVILRQNIDPQEYWNERKKYEEGLSGNKTIHLFVLERSFLAEEMK